MESSTKSRFAIVRLEERIAPCFLDIFKCFTLIKCAPAPVCQPTPAPVCPTPAPVCPPPVPVCPPPMPVCHPISLPMWGCR